MNEQCKLTVVAIITRRVTTALLIACEGICQFYLSRELFSALMDDMVCNKL